MSRLQQWEGILQCINIDTVLLLVVYDQVENCVFVVVEVCASSIRAEPSSLCPTGSFSSLRLLQEFSRNDVVYFVSSVGRVPSRFSLLLFTVFEFSGLQLPCGVLARHRYRVRVQYN